MASYGFKLNLPHGTRSVGGPTFGQHLSSGLSKVAPYASFIGSVASGIDFFSALFRPDYAGSGLTSQEIRQAKKQNDYGKSIKGVQFALQVLSSIAAFI